MRAFYHSVETFGTVDGAGIRYVLFLAGCTLGCAFCHNPDTWSKGNKLISVDEVLADLSQYRRYYDLSGGGITVSGGEPLLQSDFVAALFKACREQGIHTTLDTSGYCPAGHAAKVAPYTDAVLFGVKIAPAELYPRLTLGNGRTVLENLRYLAAHTVLTVRYAVIPGVNNSAADFTRLAGLVQSLPRPVPVELLAYHTLGRGKWLKLGLEYRLEGVPDADGSHLTAARHMLAAHGITVLHQEC
ncbi:radical SAM protein|uniref:Pyruvate formate lyase activating enzyme n=1 Tax=Dendrosporobacter quercicolus TaxID=146817 RepID=A0A1G9XZP4_9FIRM|nr:radical SAM protein [Dendrosporobacter quercicolus]NSL49039.1 radical SAM protein [Dendrosporobacter quercicolus DSM 1736]SDN01901.1 pyruvate formate lyase activating enzyme [Dendrosporobacter quercicolus]